MKSKNLRTDRQKPLIIGVGFHKTGTSSLRRALRILGYKVKDTSERALLPILKGNYKKVLKIIEPYDAVEDLPWFMIYRELDKRIADTKFILTIREEEAWYRSVRKHIGSLRTASHEWIYGRGKGLPKEDKVHAIQMYRQHNRAVMAYFENRPDDLLVMDITRGAGWEKLCPFLNKPVPQETFPHNNRTRWNQKKYARKPFKIFRKRLRNAIKIKYLDFAGLW